MSCQSRVQSLQDYLNQDLSSISPDCKTEINDSLAAASPTSCFNDPLQNTVGATGGGGMAAAAQAQAATYRAVDQGNQTQKNYCYLHANRVTASCTPEEAKYALKAFNDYANCSEARSVAARSYAAQAGASGSAASAKPAYTQTAGLSGVAMACYLGVCSLTGGVDTAKAALNANPISHVAEDMESTGSSQPKPRSPSSAVDIP